MPFKTSFFNPTLFRKNLSRSWPLWGGVTAVGAMFPLYMILAVISGETLYLDRAEFAGFLYSAAVYILPAATFCYAALVAMFVWSYLHNSRSVGMMHSLAVSRDTLFVTNTLSGLAMLLIPYVVVGGSLCVFAVCYGAMDVGAVALTILSVLLENLLFFGLATFCAMITGNLFAVAGYYLVLNFLAPVLDLLLNAIAQKFIFGLTDEISLFSLYFAPVAGLYEGVGIENHYNADHTELLPPTLEGFWLIAVYGLVGVLLLTAAWALYRVRRSESAGDIVAFRALRPVFRFAVAVFSALTLGHLLYELFWGTLFAQGDYADLVPLLICMAAAATVGYYIASMLLEKTLRVFKGSLKGVAAVCAATVVIGVVLSMDFLGIESYVPDGEDVASMEVWGGINMTYNADKHDTALYDTIATLHRAVIADEKYILDFDTRYDWAEDVHWTNLHFNYRMKDGSRVERNYVLPISFKRMEESGTYDAALAAALTDPAVLLAGVTLPKSAELNGVMLEGYHPATGDPERWNMGPEACEAVYAALLQDAREGNFHADSNLRYMWEKGSQPAAWDRFDQEIYMFVDYWHYENGARQLANLYLYLEPTMEHTLKALADYGVVTEEIVDGWNG